MPFSYTVDQSRATLSLSGELGHHEAISIMSGIADTIEAELPAQVVLDLSGLSFMDSSGIAVIVQANRKCREIGASLEVHGTPHQAMRILKAAGIDKAVTFK